MDDFDFEAMKRWQWWLVVTMSSPIIIVIVTAVVISYLLEYIGDGFHWMASIFDKIGNARTPDWFKKAVKFAKGE
ncbi:MAG: hypothetical protein ACRCUK_08635 [Plesiomonas shigelloides]